MLQKPDYESKIDIVINAQSKASRLDISEFNSMVGYKLLNDYLRNKQITDEELIRAQDHLYEWIKEQFCLKNASKKLL